MCKILAQLGNCKATLIDNELLKFSRDHPSSVRSIAKTQSHHTLTLTHTPTPAEQKTNHHLKNI